jgi:hypothetical protein
VSVESKNGLFSECAACVAELGANVGACDEENGGVDEHCADRPIIGGVWDRATNLLNKRDKSEYTGHKKGIPVLRWVRASILLPLFWSTKMIVMYAARLSRSGVLCGRVCFVLERKITPPTRTITSVFPGNFVFVYLQARQAKKKEPRTRLAATLGALSQRAMVSAPEESKSAQSSRGVMAFCLLGVGSWLS